MRRADAPHNAIYRHSWRYGPRRTRAKFGANLRWIVSACSVQRAEGHGVQNPTNSDNQRKERTQSPEWVIEFFWLRRWDLNLMTFGL